MQIKKIWSLALKDILHNKKTVSYNPEKFIKEFMKSMLLVFVFLNVVELLKQLKNKLTTTLWKFSTI